MTGLPHTQCAIVNTTHPFDSHPQNEEERGADPHLASHRVALVVNGGERTTAAITGRINDHRPSDHMLPPYKRLVMAVALAQEVLWLPRVCGACLPSSARLSIDRTRRD